MTNAAARVAKDKKRLKVATDLEKNYSLFPMKNENTSCAINKKRSDTASAETIYKGHHMKKIKPGQILTLKNDVINNQYSIRKKAQIPIGMFLKGSKWMVLGKSKTEKDLVWLIDPLGERHAWDVVSFHKTFSVEENIGYKKIRGSKVFV